MEFIRWRDKTKKSYGNHMKANVEKNTILTCVKIRATLHHIMQENVVLLITMSDIFRLNCELNIITTYYTNLKNCIAYRVSVWNLSDDVTKQKSHMVIIWKQMLRRIQILMCLKIKSTSHYAIKCCSFDYHIKYSQIRTES